MAAKVVVAVGLVHVTVDEAGQHTPTGHVHDASAARDGDLIDRTDRDDSVLIDQDRSARNGFAARSVDQGASSDRGEHGSSSCSLIWSGPIPGPLPRARGGGQPVKPKLTRRLSTRKDIPYGAVSRPDDRGGI